MTDDRLTSLLNELAPEPRRGVDAEALVTKARRRETRRRTVASLVTAGLVVVAAVLFWPRPHLAAVPAANPSTTASSADASGGPDSSASCPRVRPGTDDASADYIDLLLWQGETYVSTSAPPRETTTGGQVTTIGCSIAELTEKNHNLVEPMPWPDRTATFLPSKTPVYALANVPVRCAVAVKKRQSVSIYTAVDMNDPHQQPVCPAERGS